MLYLLDANTLINAKKLFYPIDRVPEFWNWLIHQGQEFKIKIPVEIYDEFHDTISSNGEKDDLASWAEQQHVKDALLLDEEADQRLVAHVISEGYVQSPTESDLKAMGKDPFLISYALNDIENRIIVTAEVSKPRRQGKNRHVPDVCDHFGIDWISNYKLIEVLNFSTSWHSR